MSGRSSRSSRGPGSLLRAVGETPPSPWHGGTWVAYPGASRGRSARDRPGQGQGHQRLSRLTCGVEKEKQDPRKEKEERKEGRSGRFGHVIAVACPGRLGRLGRSLGLSGSHVRESTVKEGIGGCVDVRYLVGLVIDWVINYLAGGGQGEHEKLRLGDQVGEEGDY